MVDCGSMLELLRADPLRAQFCSHVGTGWEQHNRLNLCDVPSVPAVPIKTGRPCSEHRRCASIVGISRVLRSA